MTANKLLCLAGALILIATACQEQVEKRNVSHSPIQLYGGGQGDNGFMMWIWIYEDHTIPAVVRSGLVRYIKGEYIDTDEEKLIYRPTENGFTLSDTTTGNVLYTATSSMDEYGNAIHVTWEHSPGTTWDSLAKEKGWQREVTLHLQIEHE